MDNPKNGHNYVVLTLQLHATANSPQSGEALLTIALTCHGYFRCDEGHTPEDIEAYFDAEEEGYAKKCIAQVYPAAVLEFDRLVKQAGLPSMNLMLSPPSNVQVVKEEIQSVAKRASRPRSASSKKVKSPK